MGVRNLYRPFEMVQADLESWSNQPMTYHFFEIIHIQEGSGIRVVNQNRFPYRKGSVFLFTPRDCRGFEVTTPTRFISVRFSDLFVGQCTATAERARIGEWLKQLEYLFFNHNKQEELLIKQPGDCKMIASLMSNMLTEYEQKPAYYESNLQYFVTLLLNIVARNVSGDSSRNEKTDSEPLISRMVTHIKQQIYYPQELKLEFLATKFNLSANYVGEYFKKQTGESLQQFIICYKLNLVELRVSYSDLTIGEIAYELGFTDESHLSRLFKKYFGMSPAMFRKQRKEQQAHPEIGVR
ncbi:AraC family transcriptional regulator [Chitinophaga nivalis]|uniref:AraC family transcriptional regulator n=1 Tax=Chitinophaga nivalis TaxID=2991709 RepID=A0ABT3IPG8_9BACT|nr:AraC family transcriptional regulator [Chitinophaga nivalis]MCW3464445.1 AraC family transcriptional regulator [Chitinophaga nivalis]MCW3485864.1 AraC family transcriptional regulator [Chitinophaga nivalis]